uniref:Uncharacterized protein n=1 Tax=Arundo donax TaxID=35708 RepID=A0A0A9DSP0_ARUDO
MSTLSMPRPPPDKAYPATVTCPGLMALVSSREHIAD